MSGRCSRRIGSLIEMMYTVKDEGLFLFFYLIEVDRKRGFGLDKYPGPLCVCLWVSTLVNM